MALGASDGPTRLELALPLVNDPVRSVRLEAARLLAPLPREVLSAKQQPVLELALAEYEQVQWSNIDRVEANLNLGWVRAARGDAQEAERAYRRALEIEPGFVPALVNLADLYRALGRDAEGEALLRQATRADPDNADVHHALGLLLARVERVDEAVVELELASTLRPETSRYAYVFAIALNSIGERERAMATLEAVHGKFPTESEPLIALASFARDAGDAETALYWATKLLELAPGDPDLQAFVAELRND
jgi:tetratricopeptide (TPR) repeat protein